MIITEFIILLIGFIVYILQSRFKQTKSETSRKLVYWTVLFFISVCFNSILVSSYGSVYLIETYWTLNTIIVIALLAIGYAIIQAMSPFNYMKNIKKKIGKIKKSSGEEADIDKEEIEEMLEIIKEKTKYTKQQHFEVFLETICWLGFISIFILHGFVALINNLSINSILEGSLVMVICVIIMATVPITLRQIIYYLFRIRSIKEENLTEQEIEFNNMLNKENVRL